MDYPCARSLKRRKPLPARTFIQSTGHFAIGSRPPLATKGMFNRLWIPQECCGRRKRGILDLENQAIDATAANVGGTEIPIERPRPAVHYGAVFTPYPRARVVDRRAVGRLVDACAAVFP
jgi:hypothetical protein